MHPPPAPIDPDNKSPGRREYDNALEPRGTSLIRNNLHFKFRTPPRRVISHVCRQCHHAAPSKTPRRRPSCRHCSCALVITAVSTSARKTYSMRQIFRQMSTITPSSVKALTRRSIFACLQTRVRTNPNFCTVTSCRDHEGLLVDR